MSYTCRLYIGTGFNTINIPDTPALLESACASYLDVNALDIYQDGGILSEINVHVTGGFSSIAMVDYARVGDYYYYVNGDGIQMLSSDTARIPLSINALLSMGGVGSFECLDGITRRVHVASDSYGQYTEADDLLAPSQEMELKTYLHSGSSNNNVVVKSTIDLYTMGLGTSDSAETYTDPATDETVTVPVTIPNTLANATQYYLGETDSEQLNGESTSTLFSTRYDDVLTGLNKANYIGVTGAITAQVAIPSSYVKLTLEDGRVTQAVGVDETETTSDIPFDYFNSVKNERVNYSEYMAYGLITASGGKTEFRPSQIYDGNTNPTLRYICDPHTDGKPYFRYNSFQGDTSRSYFFANAVAGMPWKQIPLTYEGASGKYQQDLALAQSQEGSAYKLQSTLHLQSVNAAGQLAGGLGGGLIQIASGMSGDGSASDIIGGIGTMAGAIGSSIENKLQMNKMIEDYKMERKLEREAYEANTRIYTPNVQFPYSSDIFNDLYNNPCICYRLVYTYSDAVRIDKLLTMYGYRRTKALQASDFTNRQYFNYIEASCSVRGTGTIKSRWLNDLAGMQLASGVRIWHVAPNSSYYSENPVAS